MTVQAGLEYFRFLFVGIARQRKLFYGFGRAGKNGARAFSASLTDSASASRRISPGTHIGNGLFLDTCAPLFVCSSHTCANCSGWKRDASFARAGQSLRWT